MPAAVGNRTSYDALVSQMSTALRSAGTVAKPFNKTNFDGVALRGRLQELEGFVKRSVDFQNELRSWGQGDNYTSIQGILQQTVAKMRSSPLEAKQAQVEWLSRQAAVKYASS